MLRARIFTVFACMSLCGMAAADTTLGTITVTGTTSDGHSIAVPFFMYGTPHVLPPAYASIPYDGIEIEMTQEQYCSALKAKKPANCSLATFPAAQGFPSANGGSFHGNGCGADPYSSAIGSAILSGLYGDWYSGDLNKPIKGNPSIDFTPYCNQHDEDYTGPMTKAQADNKFAESLKSYCATSGDYTLCSSFANDYVATVKSGLANGAYEADQAVFNCSVWGNSMKESGCKG